MVEIRDAATVILFRNDTGCLRILMGQRGSQAAFMPNKYVFPGGSVDPEDKEVPVAKHLAEKQKKILQLFTEEETASALPIAAVRELWEETGLKLAAPYKEEIRFLPKNWEEFFNEGYGPDLSGLTFFLRAITPPGRPRRFDARFFFCDVSHVSNDPDDFSKGSSELGHLKWFTLEETKVLALPKITEVAIQEIKSLGKNMINPKGVPFFNDIKGGFAHTFLKTEK